MLFLSQGQKLFCIIYVHHETLMVSSGTHMEEGHILLQLLLLSKHRMGTEAQYQGTEEFSQP